MLWHFLSVATPTGVTPLDNAGNSVIGYLLSFGPLGIFALAMAWLSFKGWRLMSPKDAARARREAREEGRADLIAERDRVLEEKHKAESERDEALRTARTELVPLLQSFVATTSTLVPLLQEIVLHREALPRRRRGGPDP